jgi:hypothetical protein
MFTTKEKLYVQQMNTRAVGYGKPHLEKCEVGFWNRPTLCHVFCSKRQGLLQTCYTVIKRFKRIGLKRKEKLKIVITVSVGLHFAKYEGVLFQCSFFSS